MGPEDHRQTVVTALESLAERVKATRDLVADEERQKKMGPAAVNDFAVEQVSGAAYDLANIIGHGLLAIAEAVDSVANAAQRT